MSDKSKTILSFIGLIAIALAIIMSANQIKIVYDTSLPKNNMTGTLPVTDTDIFFEIAKGNIEGHEDVFKFGANPSVSSDEEVIWDGSDTYIFLENASRLSISSTSITDNYYTQDTGAWNLVILGLDENYLEISEFLILNGTNPVITDNFFLRTFRMQIINSGAPSPTDDANEGTITAETLIGGIDQAIILPSNGQTLMSIYTVPANKTAYVTGINVAVGEGKQAIIKAKARQCTNTTICAFANKYSIDLFESAFIAPLDVPFEVPEKTDIAFTAKSSSAGTSVSATFGIILVDNNLAVS